MKRLTVKYSHFIFRLYNLRYSQTAVIVLESNLGE